MIFNTILSISATGIQLAAFLRLASRAKSAARAAEYGVNPSATPATSFASKTVVPPDRRLATSASRYSIRPSTASSLSRASFS